jgi:hypothetical protein
MIGGRCPNGTRKSRKSGMCLKKGSSKSFKGLAGVKGLYKRKYHKKTRKASKKTPSFNFGM